MKTKDMNEQRMDRGVVSFGTADDHDRRERRFWAKAGHEERFRTITYLRECFYGPKATTGRLQEVYRFSKRKQG